MRYGVQGSGSTHIVNVSGGDATEATISGLTPSTMYSIEVAAVNSAGIGAYSSISSFISSNDNSEWRFVTCLIRYDYILWKYFIDNFVFYLQ